MNCGAISNCFRITISAFIFIVALLPVTASHAWEYNPAPSPTSDSKIEPDLSAIEVRAQETVNYCKQQKKELQPDNGCGCLYNAYVSYGNANRNSNIQMLNKRRRELNEVAQLLQDKVDFGLFMRVQNFCDDYFKDTDLVSVRQSARDKGKLRPKFEKKEDEIEYVNKEFELRKATRGLSARYCNIYYNIYALQKEINKDPLAKKDMDAVLLTLKRAPGCYSR